MFLKNSRYYGLDTVSAKDRSGRTVSAVKLRKPAVPAGDPVTIRQSDRLDVMAEKNYADATRFWHIADANTELEANALVQTPGRTITVPKS